jgi:hypothetical protein
MTMSTCAPALGCVGEPVREEERGDLLHHKPRPRILRSSAQSAAQQCAGTGAHKYQSRGHYICWTQKFTASACAGGRGEREEPCRRRWVKKRYQPPKSARLSAAKPGYRRVSYFVRAASATQRPRSWKLWCSCSSANPSAKMRSTLSTDRPSVKPSCRIRANASA